MSNTQVGVVYQQIIADVIESSRVDFEEGGVDENVLEALRQGWQKKLSQLEVAAFPWDPKPDPIPPLSNPTSVSSNGGGYQLIGNQAMPQQPIQQIGTSNSNGPRIKTEPGLENSSVPQYGSQISNLPPTTTTAQQRAAAHLHNNYGPRAAASINAIQQGALHGQQGGPTMQQIQAMQIMQHQHQQPTQQLQSSTAKAQNQPVQQIAHHEYKYNQSLEVQTSTNQQSTRQNNSQADLEKAQIDGTCNTNYIKECNNKMFAFNHSLALSCRTEIDSLIHLKVRAMGKLMEGGGLMLPLNQATSISTDTQVNKHNLNRNFKVLMDGGNDDDNDEDAINSDLDDPDEGLNNDEEEEDGMGHIMLCMYDKVQRVKNKWKCVMKDGVLTVNNKEYVFHKASGEYEW